MRYNFVRSFVLRRWENMEVLKSIKELQAKEIEQLRERFLEATGLVGEDDEVFLEIEPQGDSHFSVLLSCKTCGYRAQICTLHRDDPSSWRHGVASNADNAIRRFFEHQCAEVVKYGGKASRSSAR
jgi:hypothetical protein